MILECLIMFLFSLVGFNRDISDSGVSGTLGYLLSDLMSLRKLYCLFVFVCVIFVLL